MERDINSIEAGKLADLVVQESNLFEIAPEPIHGTKVVTTCMNGQVTHGQASSRISGRSLSPVAGRPGRRRADG